MEEQFVTLEQAIRLKDLGFDEECLCLYDDNKLQIMTQHSPDVIATTKNSNMHLKSSINEVQSVIAAPLYQQAFDWLREKHDIFYHIYDNTGNDDNALWFYEVTHDIHYYVSKLYKTYYEAKNAALNYIINELLC